MQYKSRRTALKEMAALTFGGSIFMQGCAVFHSQNGTAKNSKSLLPTYIPAGTFPKAPDGIGYGDGVKSGEKVRSEYTNGQMCCQEIYLKPKQAGPPPHLHKELDEIMRVVEGDIHVMVDKTVTVLHAGDWHVRPHGLIHTFWNAGDIPALAIDIYPNQDFLSFFEELIRIQNKLQRRGLPLQSEEGQRMNNALLKKYGIEMFPEQFPPIIEKYGLTV